jgi:hypothetical protein
MIYIELKRERERERERDGNDKSFLAVNKN